MRRKLIWSSILLFFFTSVVMAQITGKVEDEYGPLNQAVVALQGQRTKVLTDENGNFSINGKVGDVLIIVDPLTLNEKRFPVEKLDMGVLKLLSKEIELKVVVGYGTQKKVNMTGTVNTVSADEIKGKATSSLTNALQGVTPGVTVISRPGNVGGDMGSINVRGRGNLGSASPLYIVDGIPVSAGDFQRIPSNDVESISILKDAAATAIYGARAAYGVFLVTTKKGKEGKASVSYNGYYGLQKGINLPEKLNALEFALLSNEANINAGKKPAFTDEQIEKIKAGNSPDLYPNNDWYKMFYREVAPMQEHNVSLSGGGKTKYYVSGTFFDQESLVPGTDLKRYSFRTNTERQFSDKFKLGTNVSYTLEKYKRKGDWNTQNLDRMSPLSVAKHTDGTWGTVTAGSENTVNASNNPIRRVEEGGWGDYETNRFVASLNAEYKPFKDLSITGVMSYKTYDERSSSFTNRVDRLVGFISKQPLAGTDTRINRLSKTWKHNYNLMNQLYATYTKTIDKHDLSLMAGLQYEDYYYEYLSARRDDYPSNALTTINAGSGKAENLGNGGDHSARKFFSQFGRLTYAFDSRYLFEANVRVDQSSQFAPEKRVGVFPSFSAGWRISQEDFMKDIHWLNNLKLRASWGKAGYVNNVGYYDYFDVLGLGPAYITGGVLADGVWPSLQVNKNFTWETVTTTNFGFDLAVLKNRLELQADVFNKEASDILLKTPQPYELGLTNDERAAVNGGVVNNKGIELSLKYNGSIQDFKYSISGNFSKIWNEIKDLKGMNDQIEGYWIKREGGSIGDFYGFVAEGLFVDKEDIKNHANQQSKNTAPGDIKYKDLNGDGKITAEDRTVLGNDVPYLTYGVNINMSYKNFDLSIQGQGVDGVSVYLFEEATQAFFNGAGAKKYHLGRWTKENPNPNAVYPRLLPTSDNNHNGRKSSFWLYDADYFRIKNISLGYTLPRETSEKIGLQNLRLYIAGTNMFTIRADKRLKDFDPESPSARGTYPSIKTVSFGANISF
ncbi:TonB-dependent receptor [Ornithobacterium rhinotracheale]|uniref:SusC/RagA family TonB-linked outer membrane protein n=1 Tax=Ornithobacterium rhinotracheale TaxID=28251 RepID=UPI00129C7EE8|nr:TonB-dependent receptor [Ornithobacterium rhinotracheale]MRI62444.1 TonB-dependent receptor [Ornithobacterium rhinotracheale]